MDLGPLMALLMTSSACKKMGKMPGCSLMQMAGGKLFLIVACKGLTDSREEGPRREWGFPALSVGMPDGYEGDGGAAGVVDDTGAAGVVPERSLSVGEYDGQVDLSARVGRLGTGASHACRSSPYASYLEIEIEYCDEYDFRDK